MASSLGPSPVSASAAFRRSSPVLVPESPAQKAPKPSLALPARQARNFPQLNRGDGRAADVPRKRQRLRARPKGQWDAGWLGARAPAACLLSQLPVAGLAPRSLLRCPRLRGVANAAYAALVGWEGSRRTRCAAVATAAQPTCQSLSGLLFNLVTHSPLDLLSWLFFFLFILFFKILSPNWPPLALLSGDKIAFAAVGNVTKLLSLES